MTLYGSEPSEATIFRDGDQLFETCRPLNTCQCCSQVVTMSPKHVVFKKVSRDKSVTVYMAKRDFVDHCDFVDPVDGIVLIDPVQVKGKKVYVMLSCTFRYGRQDMDVMGVAFRRDLFLVIRQVYPELQDKEKLTHTKIQQKLLRKLGNNAYPFFFEFPDNLPCSVALQPGPSDEGKKCAVEFEVKAFCGDSHDDINKQSSVHLTIRKIQFSPEDTKVTPLAETTFEFLMSEKPLNVKLSLPKETFYHGEPVPVTIEITNSSNRNIKDISISVEQVTNIILYANDKYVKSVAKEETCDSVPSGTSLKTNYLVSSSGSQQGQTRTCTGWTNQTRGHKPGFIKHSEAGGAEGGPGDARLLQGRAEDDRFWDDWIQVDVFKTRPAWNDDVNVYLLVDPVSQKASELSLELPFKLMHPKPEPGTDHTSYTLSSSSSSSFKPELNINDAFSLCFCLTSAKPSDSDDMVFEEFKRAYLKGVVYGDDDESPTEA
ncbi:S-arrestin Retinal S-antigen [Larimichthys crocea]|uniref:S-arrestin n=1 Tax=Larimichthys crocea TaxID=215358 RepID=A0A6G0ITI4_LARCR|nr:S-arrestin Retinal S-antigen [Larimichthys crocea]